MKPPQGLHQILDLSDRDRVLFVTDVHGEYSCLEQGLHKFCFNPERDALIIGGDLADRGPESEKALEWIHKPSVHRILGNHDIVPRMYLEGQLDRYTIEERYGGAWFTEQSRESIEHIAREFENAPVALTVLTPRGKRVGIIHADCGGDWTDWVSKLHKVDVFDTSLWSRETFNSLLEAHENKQLFNIEPVRVANIDHVFHGHTVVGAPFTIDNRTWADTGACFGYELTLLDIDRFLEG